MKTTVSHMMFIYDKNPSLYHNNCESIGRIGSLPLIRLPIGRTTKEFHLHEFVFSHPQPAEFLDTLSLCYHRQIFKTVASEICGSSITEDRVLTLHKFVGDLSIQSVQ